MFYSINWSIILFVFISNVYESEPSNVYDCDEVTARDDRKFDSGVIQTNIIHYPWHVGIYRRYVQNINGHKKNDVEYICGGNIITKRIILSVATCFTEPTGEIVSEYINKRMEYLIAAGKVYRDYDDPRDKNIETREVINITIPSQYKGYTLLYTNDIALLELDEELPRNNIIRSICLDYDFQPNPNSIGTVVGWGLVEKGDDKGKQLKKLNIPIIEKDECFRIVPDDYKPYLVNDHICAGVMNGSSVCSGDTGDGLVFSKDDKKHYVLIGLVSNGPSKDGGCDWNQIATYTDIKKHQEFIRKSVRSIEDRIVESRYKNCGRAVAKADGEFDSGVIQTNIIHYPWHVGIYRRYVQNINGHKMNDVEYICGGNIITKRIILSVASCFTDYNGGIVSEYVNKRMEYLIAAGKVYRDYDDPRDKNIETREVINITIPSQYKGYTLLYSNDIALLELDEELPRNNIIRSICLDYDFQPNPNSIGTVVGWGLVEKGNDMGKQLKKLNIPIIEKDECLRIVPDYYKPYLVNDHICAGVMNGSSVCSGDSGDGLVFSTDDKKHYVLIGLVSHGPLKDDKCDWNQIASYTNINKHQEFITKSVKAIEDRYLRSKHKLTCPAVTSDLVVVRCRYKGKYVACDNQNGLLHGTVLRMECKEYFRPRFLNQTTESVCMNGIWMDNLLECEPECGPMISAQTLAIGATKTNIIYHPWHVGIYYYYVFHNEYHYKCGGNIINPKVILSAAHCFTEGNGEILQEYLNKETEFYIATSKTFREYNDSRDVGVQKRKVINVIKHPLYLGILRHYSNDIALLELDEELVINDKTRSICLDFKFGLNKDLFGTVVGFGVTEKNGSLGDPQLRKLNVPFIEKRDCFLKVSTDYLKYLVDDHICAGFMNGSSVCDGDSGGGLVFLKNNNHYVLIGLVSNSPAKGDMCDYDTISTYTEIRKHQDFIEDNIKKIL